MNWSLIRQYVEIVWPWIAVIVGLTVVAFWAHRRGYAAGRESARLEGAFCDVCENVKDKFVFFRGTVMCRSCYEAVLSNKEMECRFCKEKIEKCSCT